MGWDRIEGDFYCAIAMPTYQAKIYVTLRPSVLDPAGTAVCSGLHHMGFTGVDEVRIGKYIEVTLSADDEGRAQQQLNQMCDQLLTNPVIENYRFDIQTKTPAASPN